MAHGGHWGTVFLCLYIQIMMDCIVCGHVPSILLQRILYDIELGYDTMPCVYVFIILLFLLFSHEVSTLRPRVAITFKVCKP